MTSFDISGSFMQRIGKRRLKWVTPARTECRDGWVRPPRIYGPKWLNERWVSTFGLIAQVFSLAVFIVVERRYLAPKYRAYLHHRCVGLCDSTCLSTTFSGVNAPHSTWLVMQRPCPLRVNQILSIYWVTCSARNVTRSRNICGRG